MAEAADVVVVGGGPAGLAAATELRRLGVARVVVLEREAEAGGIPRHCGHPPFGMREFHRILRGPDYAARLVARARAAGVEIRTRVTVTALNPGGHLNLSTHAGLADISGRAVLLATGVRESSRAQRLIGGEKPGGVLSTGALQGLVYLNGQAPFRRPVILGSELVAFSALLTCRHAGIRPVAMVEPGERPTAWSPAPLLPRAMGVPFLPGTEVAQVLGRERVEAVVLADRNGQREVPADGLIVSGAFRPEATLPRAAGLALDPGSLGPEVDPFGRLSDPACFAAGNVLRAVETAGWCWAEGRRTARAIAAALAGRLPPRERAVRVVLGHPALKLALPQILLGSGVGQGATRHLQLRLARAVRGRLVLRQGDRVLAQQRLAGLPERRILVPLPALAAGDDLRLELEEAA